MIFPCVKYITFTGHLQIDGASSRSIEHYFYRCHDLFFHGKVKYALNFGVGLGLRLVPLHSFFYRSGTGLEKDLVLENYSRLA